MLVEVQVYLAEEAGIEFGVSLELDFDEPDGLVGCVRFGQKDTFDSKGGLFEFNGAEFVAIGAIGGLSKQLKEDAGDGLEDPKKTRAAKIAGETSVLD